MTDDAADQLLNRMNELSRQVDALYPDLVAIPGLRVWASGHPKPTGSGPIAEVFVHPIPSIDVLGRDWTPDDVKVCLAFATEAERKQFEKPLTDLLSGLPWQIIKVDGKFLVDGNFLG